MVGEPPMSVSAFALPDNGRYHQDNVSLVFRFSNGSVGTLDYLANGNKNFSKEHIEVFSAGKIGVLDDFRSLELVSESNRVSKKSHLGQDKGHQAAWKAFCTAITRGEGPTIPYQHLIGVSQACFSALESLHTGKEISL